MKIEDFDEDTGIFDSTLVRFLEREATRLESQFDTCVKLFPEGLTISPQAIIWPSMLLGKCADEDTCRSIGWCIKMPQHLSEE